MQPNLKNYVSEVKKRVELVVKAYASGEGLKVPEIALHTRNLVDYLEGLDYFVEEEKMICDICHNPLYKRQDGSTVCIDCMYRNETLIK